MFKIYVLLLLERISIIHAKGVCVCVRVHMHMHAEIQCGVVIKTSG